MIARVSCLDRQIRGLSISALAGAILVAFVMAQDATYAYEVRDGADAFDLVSAATIHQAGIPPLAGSTVFFEYGFRVASMANSRYEQTDCPAYEASRCEERSLGQHGDFANRIDRLVFKLRVFLALLSLGFALCGTFLAWHHFSHARRLSGARWLGIAVVLGGLGLSLMPPWPLF